MGKVEILAPAGSFESMKAAFYAGADAVYMGGKSFGARAYAENPDDDGLLRAIDYANIHGKKLYLTLNTLVKENEIDSMLSFLKPLYEQGLNAVLIQDLGVFNIVRNAFPLLPIHASTQMTLCGIDGVNFLKEKGIERAVLSRELSLKEIKEIKEATGIDIEVFVHGALCYCYSGQCLYSSLLGGRSGNRGRCAQPCRLNYDVFGDGRKLNYRDESSTMSLKDICALEDIPDLVDAGVDSFKIEGRMKSAEYAALSSYLYRKYTDLYLEKGRDGFRISKEDKGALLGLYNRSGYSHGYLHENNGRDMVTLQSGAYGSSSGSTFYDIKALWLDKDLKENVEATVKAYPGKEIELTLECKDASVTVYGEEVGEAANRPLDMDTLNKQMGKTGGTAFALKEVKADIGEGAYVSLKGLNALRRDAVDALQGEILNKFKRCEAPLDIDSLRYKDSSNKKKGVSVELCNGEYLKNVGKFKGANRIYIEYDILAGDCHDILNEIHEMGAEVFIALPYILRNDLKKRISKRLETFKEMGADGWLVRNLESLELVKNLGGKIQSDYQFYTWNRYAMEFLHENGVDGFTAPVEENYRELMNRGMDNTELIVYGYIPLMVSAQCFLKTTGNCRKEVKKGNHPIDSVFIKDRMNKKFFVKANCGECNNLIYNSSPIALIGCNKELTNLNADSVRLIFVNEDVSYCEKIFKGFVDELLGKDVDLQIKDFTRGHLRRGVE